MYAYQVDSDIHLCLEQPLNFFASETDALLGLLTKCLAPGIFGHQLEGQEFPDAMVTDAVINIFFEPVHHIIDGLLTL